MLPRTIRLATAFAVLAAGIALLPAVHRAAAAPSLPAGFQVETIPSGQVAGDLTGFAMVPAGLPGAGGAFTIGKAGKVVWVSADGTTVRTIAQLPVWAHQDIGLIGISVTKHYGETGKLLVMYTDNPTGTSHFAHAAVMTVDDPADPTSMTETQALLSGDTPDTQVEENSLSHGPGTIVEGPDGYIYIGFGDESRYQDADPAAYRAQQLDDPHGKILRVDWSGHGVPANPYYQAAAPDSWQSRVFVRGVRNPFRFGFDARTGRLYIGDVGWSSWEEVDVARGGEDFGWPCYEGLLRTTGHQNLPNCKAMYAANTPVNPPLYTYPHTPGGVAVVGGVFYTGTSYPAAYRGRYFFGDYVTGFINTLATDTKDQLTVAPARFASGLGSPVAFDTAPNGDVVFADIASGSLKRLRYSAGNRPPVAAAEATNNPDTLTVHVDASASYDLDGDRLTYSTTFGDGSAPVAGVTADHHYNAAGTYTVTVKVTDVSGAVGQTTLRVTPQNHTPTLNMVAPDDTQTYAVGDPVQLSATASDAEDPDLDITWTVVLKHCPFGGPCHDHFDQIDLHGATFNEPFTDHGGDTYMQVTAKVTDSAGAVAVQVFNARPELQTISVTSAVPVTINGFNTSSLQVVAGQPVTVAAPATQQEWTLTGWSDGGAATHTFPTPTSDVSLTATYTNAIDAKYAELGGPTGVLGVATGPTVDITGGLAGGRFRPYVHGAIIWSAAAGAHEVGGGILAKYWPVRDTFGFPTSDELAVTGGRASTFQRGNAYWSAATGVGFVRGGDLVMYLALGGPTGYGLPLGNETTNPDKRGTRQHFSGNRSIYYLPGIGSREVHGGIRTKWASLGWERSHLGYPTTNEVSIPTGRRSSFQNGYIDFNSVTHAIVVTYTR